MIELSDREKLLHSFLKDNEVGEIGIKYFGLGIFKRIN